MGFDSDRLVYYMMTPATETHGFVYVWIEWDGAYRTAGDMLHEEGCGSRYNYCHRARGVVQLIVRS